MTRPRRHAVGGLHRARGQSSSGASRAPTAASPCCGMSGAAARSPGLRTPQQLYEDWERAHWAAQDVDLDRDPARLGRARRARARPALLGAELADGRRGADLDAVLRPRLAQDDEEEGSYLSTQLVDEVRHMQFYARFQNEVIADPAAIAAHVGARARGARRRRSGRSSTRRSSRRTTGCARDPRNREAKVDFVTIYHMILEGTLGITASHFLLDFLGERDVLPGFVDGYGEDRRRRAAPHRLRARVPAQRGRERPGDGGRGAGDACSTCCPPSPSRCRRRARAPGTCSASRTARSAPTG